MDLDWNVLFTARALADLTYGFKITLLASALSWVGAFLLGSVAALLRISGQPLLMAVGSAWINFFRNVPLLVQLLFWYFGLPTIVAPANFPALFAHNYELKITVLAIALYAGAYMAEVMRAGIEAVPNGQLEAAYSTGLSRRQAFQSIVMPQVGPVCLPGLTSETINVIKDTSLSMTIGLVDLMSKAQQLDSDTFRGFEIMTAVTAVYFTLSLVIVGAGQALERAYRYSYNASHTR
jgi:polar amino acid transport system permease protein